MEETHDKQSESEAFSLAPETMQWLKPLYEEGWRQYVHEDNLGQSRSNFFLGVQAAIIAILAALSKSVYGIGISNILDYPLNIGLMALGSLWIIVSLFFSILLVNWDIVTSAGKEYVRFRRIQLQSIEKLAGIEQIGLANQESEWLEKKEDYVLFPNIVGLKHLKVPPIISDSGWVTMKRTVSWLRSMWVLILIAGLVALLMGASPIWQI